MIPFNSLFDFRLICKCFAPLPDYMLQSEVFDAPPVQSIVSHTSAQQVKNTSRNAEYINHHIDEDKLGEQLSILKDGSCRKKQQIESAGWQTSLRAVCETRGV